MLHSLPSKNCLFSYRDCHAKRSADFRRCLQHHTQTNALESHNFETLNFKLSKPNPLAKNKASSQSNPTKNPTKNRGWHITPIRSNAEIRHPTSSLKSSHLKAGGTHHGILQDIAIAVKNPQFFVQQNWFSKSTKLVFVEFTWWSLWRWFDCVLTCSYRAKGPTLQTWIRW